MIARFARPFRSAVLVCVVSSFAVAAVVLSGVRGPSAVAAAGTGTATSQQASFVPGQVTEPTEIEDFRTKHSQTYAMPDGSMRTTISAAPLNHREGDEWQEVDNTLLRRSDGTAENRSAAYDVTLPKTLAEPVEVQEAGADLSFELKDAAGNRSLDDNHASYQDALPGVDVNYTAWAAGVKEELVLSSPDARRDFTFDLDLQAGIVPKLAADGSIELRQGDEVQTLIAAPLMTDGHGQKTSDLAYTLKQTSSGWQVGLDTDGAWLRAADRAWPVTVDPTIVFNDAGDTYMASGTPPAGQSSAQAGADAQYGPVSYTTVNTNGDRQRRAMVKFNLSGIPANAVVGNAFLRMHTYNGGSGSGWPIEVHKLSRGFTGGATWNKSNGTTAWTTPGGDFENIATDTVNVGANGWYSWGIGNTVADWVSGASPNYGLLLKAPVEGVQQPGGGQGASFDALVGGVNVPTMDVSWEYPTGTLPQWTFDSTQLADATVLKVNVATGNLIHQSDDIRVPGLDSLDLNLSRTYNSQSGWGVSFGYHWLLSGGDDIFAGCYSRCTTQFVHGPGDVYWRFRKRYKSDGTWDGTWVSPPGVNATLVEDSTGRTVTFNDSGIKWRLNNSDDYKLSYQESPAGKRVTFNYTGASGSRKVQSVTDTNGKTYTYGRNAYGFVTTITESGAGGRVWRYGYTPYNGNPGMQLLTSYTSPANKTSAYWYGNGTDLQRITDGDGNRTRITYTYTPAPEYLPKVASIQRMTNADWDNPVGPKTTYAYDTVNKKTTVTPPTGAPAVYTYNEATGVATRQGAPAITVGGAFFAKAFGTVYPGSYDLQVTATDGVPGPTGPGVTSLTAKVDDHLVGSTTQPCAAGGCDLAATYWINTENLSAGQHDVAVTATDATGVSKTNYWSFTADRTTTYFKIKPATTVNQFIAAVAAAQTTWTDVMYNGGGGVGGYDLGAESQADGIAALNAGLQEDYGTTAVAAVTGFTLGGDVASSRLGALSSSVVRRDVTTNFESSPHAPNLAPESGLTYTDDLLAADIAEENGQPRPQGIAARADTNPAGAKVWAPTYGVISTFTDPSDKKRPRRILETLRFSKEAIGDVDGDGDKDESLFERSGGPDLGYEHDLQLLAGDGVDVPGGSWPNCRDENEYYWAERNGHLLDTNFPEDANVYFDTNIDDPCEFMSFTVGVEYPLNLTPNKVYFIKIKTQAGTKASSHYVLNAQKMNRVCPGDPRYCSLSKGPGADGNQLAGPNTSVKTEECRRWRKGYNSRKCTGS